MNEQTIKDTNHMTMEQKLNNWTQKQGTLFPEGFKPSHNLLDVKNLDVNTCDIKIGGRILFKRQIGKICFLTLSNIETQFQVVLNKNNLGEDFDFFCENLDLGDIIGVSGSINLTSTGEKSLFANDIILLCKSIGLPNKWQDIQDQTLILHKPYLEFFRNKEKVEIIKSRIKVMAEIRKIFTEKGFLEVETPILQNVPSGAAASPFKTYYDALSSDFFLRIAPENFLKQMMVAGFDKIFEVGKCFRNEGIDKTHLQEFTMLESYASYWTFEDYMGFSQDILKRVAFVLRGSHEITLNNTNFDLNSPWPRVKFVDLFYDKTQINVLEASFDELFSYAEKEKVLDPNIKVETKYHLVDLIYKKKCSQIQQTPLIVTHYPVFYCPLAKPDQNQEELLMFQVIIGGKEIVKAYSELIDYRTQEKNFQVQEENNKKNEKGEFVRNDMALVDALKYGCTPMAGFGLGIDRLLQVILGLGDIKDSLFFVHHKPQAE